MHFVLRLQGNDPHEFKAQGWWDRNRTGPLRLWSLLPFVQQRSETYTSTLEMTLFEAPKCQEVHQRSPALGSTVWSNRCLVRSQ
jgi:hypothetical protein